MLYYNLTAPQLSIWNLQKFYPDSSISNVCGIIYYHGKMIPEKFIQALNHVIRCQSGLRLRFRDTVDGPVQYVSDYCYEDIPVMSFANKSDLKSYANRAVNAPMQLTDSKMYQFTIATVDGQTAIIALLNHLISDAWTLSLLASQVQDAYLHLAEDSSVPCYDYTETVSAFEKYVSSKRYLQDESYWSEKYAVRPDSSSIKPLVAPAVEIKAKRISTQLPTGLTEAVGKYCERELISPAVLFESCVFIYLSKLNPQNSNLTIGMPVLNRHSAIEKNTAGMYISTLPLTVDVDLSGSVLDLMKNVTSTHREIFRHQRYPYSYILRELRDKQNFSGNLYDVMVSYQNAETGVDAETEWLSNGFSEVPFALHVDNRDGSDSYVWNVDYQTEVFPIEKEVELIIERLEYILFQIISERDISLEAIQIIPETERNILLADFNDTAADFPSDKCIHDLFREHVGHTPEKVALIFENEEFSYQQLDEMSNSLAHTLRDLGIGRNDVVPIVSTRNWRTIVSMLAIFKAGGAYMPVDPAYPDDRIEYMIADAAPKVVLKYEREMQTLSDVEIIDLANFDFTRDVESINSINSPEDIFAVLFTSGTSGKPKASRLCHRGLINFVKSHIPLYSDCGTIISTCSFPFDIFFSDSICPIISGITCILTNELEQYSPNDFAMLLRKYCNANIVSTPTKLYNLISPVQEKSFVKNLNHVYVGGEVWSHNLYALLLENNHNLKVTNLYGPSEATMWVTEKLADGPEATIGRPIANTQIYILDSERNLAPIGIAGELCICGEGVAKGYLNRPELTAEKFVPCPFNPGKPMYRTGDLARWRADGEIEFLGRIDAQIKIRGLRIELEEIESVMQEISSIKQCAVTDKQDSDGRQYLVGYYVSDEVTDEKALRQYLSTKLPKYMVPNYFVKLSELPTTPSGKTDRKSLPMPVFTQQTITNHVPPKTDTEKRLVKLWEEFLHADNIGRDDDFFELGGDSLTAIAILSRVEAEFQVDISIGDIMSNPVLSHLAAAIDNAQRSKRQIAPNHKDKYVLLPQQKAIYAACQKNPSSLAYNMPAKMSLSKDIDPRRLFECLCMVMERHRSLKTSIHLEEGEIYGMYDDLARLELEDYSRKNFAEFVRPFDLSKAPLCRVAFTEGALLFDAHHIIMDGESLNIILSELTDLYNGNVLPEVQIEYSDYSDFFYKQDFSIHKDYYKNMLRCEFERLELPEKVPQEPGKVSSMQFTLSVELFSKLRDTIQQQKLTETSLFLATYGILLSKYTGKRDVLTSVILSNRIYAETESVVGMFVNTLPVLLHVGGTTNAYLSDVKETLIQLMEYQEFPMSSIAEAIGVDGFAVNTAFVYQTGGNKKLILCNEGLETEPIDTGSSKFDLLFELTPTKSGCDVRIEFDGSKYEDKLICRLFNSYEKILAQISQPNIADITALSREEFQKVVFEFNDTNRDYARGMLVYEPFEKQAEQHPERTALIFAEKRYSYKELHELTNGFALSLIELGICKGDKVAVLLDRDEKVIFAQLAILKLGAVFIPIDTRYPRERIEYILSQSQAKIIIKNSYNSMSLTRSVNIEDFDIPTVKHMEHNWIDSQETCYIIFTSGSTGQPKGCTLSHRGLVNFCTNNNTLAACAKLDRQIYLSVNTISFDYFIAESLLPLSNGYTVVLASEEESLNQEMFLGLAERSQANILQTTPTRFRLYFDERNDISVLKQFDILVSSGEPLPLDLLTAFQSHTNAVVFNPLGPSECSVWVAGGELCQKRSQYSANDITIGKPIANTQIYILDFDGHPAPIGVPGELCISGDCVGNGYVNSPELTRKSFRTDYRISDGKVIYHSGDLAKWREDGNIECLGRIDAQVKIRGLRIELTEIESVLASFPEIEQVAVIDKKYKDGTQYLAAYYVTQSFVNEEDLREYLHSKLPNYMVPNHFVKIDQIPTTPSGKVDRRALPERGTSTHSNHPFVPPRNGKEKSLCTILGKLLDCEQVGIADDFFELGGDSLRVIEYTAQAQLVGVYFTIQNVYDYPTIKALLDFLQKKPSDQPPYDIEKLDSYNPILKNNHWDKEFHPSEQDLGVVLLTGATGFLGAHILDELIKSGAEKIYCIVRRNETKSGKARLYQGLQYYFNKRYLSDCKKIVPIEGDLESNTLIQTLPEQVQLVIHTAASVKHYGSWKYFKQVNTDVTRRIAGYAKSVGAKLIHISTTSVSGNDMADQFEVYTSKEEKHFSEASLYIGQPLENVYVRSKFEAEMVVLDAMKDGLHANIVRVGNLTNRFTDLKFQPNYAENAFLRRVKAFLELGALPDYLLPLYAEFSPVDLTAKAIVILAQHMNDQYTVFHVNSNKGLHFDRMLEYLSQMGRPINVLPGEKFVEIVRKEAQSNQSYIFDTISNDFDENGKLQYDSNIRIDNDFTVRYLESLGFLWPEIDYKYISKYVDYFEQLGLL